MSFLSSKALPTADLPPVPRLTSSQTQDNAEAIRKKQVSSTGGRALTMLGATNKGFTQGISTGTAKLLGGVSA